MIIAIVATVIGIAVFSVLLYALIVAAPPTSLDEQSECIRKNAEERKNKALAKAEKRRRKEE